MVDTELTVMTLNGRRSSYAPDLLSPTKKWAARKPVMISYLTKIQPWVVGAQEFTVEMCDDVTRGLGPHWNYVGGVKEGNCPILYNTLKLDVIPGTLRELIMDSDKRKRYATLAQFAVRPTGEKVWIGTCHLASGGVLERNEAKLRLSQITKICHVIQTLGDATETILCGDFNSSTQKAPILDPVRKQAEVYGLKSIRRRLGVDRISGESWNSHHGFGERSRAEYKWIDDILTAPGIKPVKAALYRTCTYVYPRINPSDHNGIVYRVIV